MFLNITLTMSIVQGGEGGPGFIMPIQLEMMEDIRKQFTEKRVTARSSDMKKSLRKKPAECFTIKKTAEYFTIKKPAEYFTIKKPAEYFTIKKTK